MLEPLGFEIILAENGQQEIDLAQQIQPDCILTDLVMPVKSGFEAVQAIRQIPAIQDVIIIAISASVLDADRAKSRIVGCEAFLPKPIKEPQLLSLLQEYLQLKWIYEKIPSFSDNQPLATTWLSVQDLIAPSTEEIEILYELAMLGNMKKIRERADYLETLDPKYIPFAQKLKNLAQGFQEKAIVNLVQQFL
jgi:CheY-like chemotaxis protein